MKKGLEITASFLATIVLVAVALMVLLLIFGTIAGEAGSPISESFFKLFDQIIGKFFT